MNREACSGCGCLFARGFLRCPRCRTVAPLFAGRVKEEEVPKATVNSGASNAGAEPAEARAERVLELRGGHGPELVKLPEGSYMIGGDEPQHPGPEDLTVLRTAPDYASMTQVALREKAKSRSLPVGGSKADLAQRLSDHDTAQAAEQQGADA